MKNRYIFFKRLFKEHVIIFDNGKNYKTLGIDKKLIDFINNKDINYIIINNENKVEIKNCEINNYKKYLYQILLIEIIKKIN